MLNGKATEPGIPSVRLLTAYIPEQIMLLEVEINFL